jgi:hypothetical protein
MANTQAMATVTTAEFTDAINYGPVHDRIGWAEFADGWRCFFRYSTPAASGVIATGSNGAAHLTMFQRTSDGQQGARMASQTPRWRALLDHLARITRQ